MRGPRATPSYPPRETARLRAATLAWYTRNRRDLPWRRTRDPYAIWVSEIMLQQTRVETVIPYYERFLERFPDPAALARAREADVLTAWSGLGYYRRARNLHRGAAVVARNHAGRLPEDPSLLRELPGIGEYTAAAIASIAFDREAPAVDGNVIRVLARIRGWKGRRDSGPLRRAVMDFAEELARGPRPGDWTQALMELGATVCLPRDPLCPRCPARRCCRAATSGHADRYPAPATTPAPRQERRVLLLARRRGRVLLVPDAEAGGSSWTLPVASFGARTGAQAAARALAAALGLTLDPEGPASRFRHRTFSHDLAFEVWISCPGAGRAATRARVACRTRWARPEDLDSVPLRSPTMKALRRRLSDRRPVPKAGLPR
jgi:A/G-specific adenine glycosylase